MTTGKSNRQLTRLDTLTWYQRALLARRLFGRIALPKWAVSRIVEVR